MTRHTQQEHENCKRNWAKGGGRGGEEGATRTRLNEFLQLGAAMTDGPTLMIEVTDPDDPDRLCSVQKGVYLNARTRVRDRRTWKCDADSSTILE